MQQPSRQSTEYWCQWQVGRILQVSHILMTSVPCNRLGHNKHAAALKRTFSISDKRFYWLKVRQGGSKAE